MNFYIQNYWKYFSDIKPEIMDDTQYKKGVRFLFIEDNSSEMDLNSDLNYQLNLQFFRIIQAINLKEKDYYFIKSKNFKYSDSIFKKIFVLGKDSFDSLKKNQEFIKYINKYGKDSIDIIPSSFEMYTNPKLKKEAWEKLRRVINY